MNKLIIILLAICVIATGKRAKFSKYNKDHIRDFGNHILESALECSDNSLYNYHHINPNASDFLTYFQLRRDFCVSSYNHCRSMQGREKEMCSVNWRVSVSEAWNKLADEMLQIHPNSGIADLEGLLNDTQKCILGESEGFHFQ